MSDEKAISDESIRDLKAMLAGDYVSPRKAPFDLKSAHLFGGIAGLKLPVAQYEIQPGLILSQTYAYVILPAIMAFGKPDKPRAPHPGPWEALTEQGIEIAVQLSLAPGDPQLGFDRLNTLWFVTALLRLRLATPVLMAVTADRPFQEVPKSTDTANLIPVELYPRQLRTAAKFRSLTLTDLD